MWTKQTGKHIKPIGKRAGQFYLDSDPLGTWNSEHGTAWQLRCALRRFHYLPQFPNLGLLYCVQSFSSVWLTRRPTLCCWLALMFHARLAPVETYFAWIILSVHFRKSLFQWNELHFSDYATTIPHLLPGRCRQGGRSVQFNNPRWPKLFVIIIIRNWVLESNWAQWNLYEKESILSPMQQFILVFRYN